MIKTKQDVKDIKEIIRQVIKEELSIWIADDSVSLEEHGVYKRIQLRLSNKAFSEDRD